MPQPSEQWVPTAAVLVHHLQAVDSKRPKIKTQTVVGTGDGFLTRVRRGRAARNSLEPAGTLAAAATSREAYTR